jgi:hypothetical protein
MKIKRPNETDRMVLHQEMLTNFFASAILGASHVACDEAPSSFSTAAPSAA